MDPIDPKVLHIVAKTYESASHEAGLISRDMGRQLSWRWISLADAEEMDALKVSGAQQHTAPDYVPPPQDVDDPSFMQQLVTVISRRTT